MPAPYASTLPFSYADFHGGFNSRDAPSLLTDNQARDLDNIQGTVAGAIVKRNGLVTLASPANILNSLFSFESVSPYLVGAGGSSLYAVTPSGASTAIRSGVANDVRWEFTAAPTHAGQGPLYGVNGRDTPVQWTGALGSPAGDWTTTSGAVAVPNGRFVLANQNRVFVAGADLLPAGLTGPHDAGSTLFWSAIGDPTCFDPAQVTGAGWEEFDPDDGEQISAIGTVGPYVLVAKPRKLWVLISADTATVRQLSNNVGVVAHRSLASGPLGTYFLAEDRGVYLTNGSKLEPISDVIQPTIDAIGDRAAAAGAYYAGHYYLSVGIGAGGGDGGSGGGGTSGGGADTFAGDGTSGGTGTFGQAASPGGALPTVLTDSYGGDGTFGGEGDFGPGGGGGGSGSGGSAAGNDTVLDWDETLSSWWKHTFGSNQFAIWHPGGGPSQLCSAKATSAIVDVCFSPGATTDNGQPFTWVWRGPWQSPSFYRRRRFPTPYFRKRLRQVRCEGAGTVDFSLARDYAGNETLIRKNIFVTNPLGGSTFGGDDAFGGGGSFGDVSHQTLARIYTSNTVSRAYSVVFSGTSTTQDRITEYVLMLTDRVDLVT